VLAARVIRPTSASASVSTDTELGAAKPAAAAVLDAAVRRCKLKCIETRVESAWFQRLKLSHNELLSSLAFNFNLRRCSAGKDISGPGIRRRFLEFYEARGHQKLPSSSLIPDDPTVLLTIAGMLQFKPAGPSCVTPVPFPAHLDSFTLCGLPGYRRYRPAERWRRRRRGRRAAAVAAATVAVAAVAAATGRSKQRS